VDGELPPLFRAVRFSARIDSLKKFAHHGRLLRRGRRFVQPRKSGESVKPWMLYTLLTVFTWGLWGVFSKLAANYTKPRQSILFQTVGVLAFSLVVLVLERFHVEWNAPGFTWAALGGFCAFVGFLTFFAALVDGKTSTVVVLSALYPLVTIMISIAFLHERLTGKQTAGIVLALIASALLAT
jgi:bacterial/archaeal transporter family protein